MFHLAATLSGWGNVFGARRALFTLAAECAAYGQIGECIKHIPVLGQTDSILAWTYGFALKSPVQG